MTITTVLAGLAGATLALGGGYLGARLERHLDAPPTLKVVAIHPADLARAIDPNDPAAAAKLARLLEHTHAVAGRYWREGYVVLRAEALYDAPPELVLAPPAD